MSGRTIPIILGKGRRFPGFGHRPLLGLLTVPRNCRGTARCVISLADSGSRSGLVLFDSNQPMLCPWAMSSFQKLCLPLSLLSQVCPAAGEWLGGLGGGLRRETLACVHSSVCSCASGPSRKKAHLHHCQNEHLIKSLCEGVGLLSPV